jgi:hypothetical protein
MRKKEVEIEKEIVFTSCSSVCVFANSSTESLSALIFSVSELSFSISFVSSSAFLNSEKCEFVQERKKTFLNEKLVIENSVANLCETSSSNSLSLDKSCVEIIKIEKEEEKKSNSFFFEFFVIDVLFDYRQRCQEENSRKKKKKKMSFEVFNQYRKSRSILDESDAELTQEAFAKRELSKSISREERAAFVTKKIEQLKFSTTISSLQVLQMLLR